ncbi:TIGR00725 family protein [Haloarcula sp. CBA1130]|uniref:TIGR00725 family protein n=1 Tax=unclassified Haloarcula TaxID=2624677 RepID=UPI001248379B|nr:MULTISPECIES: TIGR00725 family protein [unclassified Haloarcula]KAA9399274.1 TIGR00725 family protein [Haloarcula sp. CBA1129]KAA9403787.1 TIGR00725 family protein [Haloarcula sp. CBA1130]
MRVSVIGGSTVTDDQYQQAREVGRRLGEQGHEVVCGGLTGVMEAVCRGASEAGGHTIGILPGERSAAANDYVDTAIATGLGNARNVLVVMNGVAIIAIDGGTGTLSELGHALDMNRPVAGLGTHRLDGGDAIEHVDTPAEAVEYVESAVQ